MSKVLLTAEEEWELARRYRDASLPEGERRAARDRLVTSNLGLVGMFVKRYRSASPEDREDLQQAGVLALFRAVEGFDPAFRKRFTTYAGYWVRREVERAYTGEMTRVPTPVHARQYATKLRQAADRLGPSASPEEVASASGLSPSCVEMGHASRKAASARILTLNTARRIGRHENPGWRLEREEEQGAAAAALRRLIADSGLTPAQGECLTLHAGLGGEAPRCVRDVAGARGVSVQAASAALVIALRRIGYAVAGRPLPPPKRGPVREPFDASVLRRLWLREPRPTAEQVAAEYAAATGRSISGRTALLYRTAEMRRARPVRRTECKRGHKLPEPGPCVECRRERNRTYKPPSRVAPS